MNTIFCPFCKGECRLDQCAFWHDHELTNGKISNCGIASFMQMYLNNNEEDKHNNHVNHYIDKTSCAMEERELEEDLTED